MAPKPQKALTEAQELEDGDKLLKGSVRPDGTVRKDRRIRAGYTPQDEQPAYQPRAAEAKQAAPKCPGLDNDELDALKQQALKGKQAGRQGASAPKPASAAPKPAAAAPKPAAAAAKPPAAAAGKAAHGDRPPAAIAPPQQQPPAAPEDVAAAVDRQIRALRKKLRQCEELKEKKAQGAVLGTDQEEKLVKAAEWVNEVAALEAQLKELAVVPK